MMLRCRLASCGSPDPSSCCSPLCSGPTWLMGSRRRDTVASPVILKTRWDGMGVPGKHAVLYQAKENGINPFLREVKGGRIRVGIQVSFWYRFSYHCGSVGLHPYSRDAWFRGCVPLGVTFTGLNRPGGPTKRSNICLAIVTKVWPPTEPPGALFC